jgi:carbamoyl-phosphate synthase large subunit
MAQCNILFTSVGRRVSLINQFRKALRTLDIEGRIIGADASDKSPAFHITDKSFTVPPIHNPAYISRLLEICKHENITIVIPLIDTELLIFSTHREKFNAIGSRVIISAPEVISIGMYKTETYNFFRRCQIDTPRIFLPEDMQQGNYQLPVMIKPNDGSAGKMVYRADNNEQLNFFKNYVPNAIIQEFIDGTEYTLDVFADLKGNVLCVVPRLRIEVRAGEVSKGLIVKNQAIIDAGKKVVECLTGACGCITVQCMVDKQEHIKMLEINPRFGGGAPLSIEAGAEFPKWIIQMVTGQEIGNVENSYTDGLMMLRYDDAIFIRVPT